MWRTTLNATIACHRARSTHACAVHSAALHTHAASFSSSSSWTPRADVSGRALRTAFLGYFKQHKHIILPSASLIPPASDSTLLFTSAGMVPLKEYFTGARPPPSSADGAATQGQLASAQKCLRAGGKHNDLDNVGRTARHHTLFEMLGNFSVSGAYGKTEAIEYAWRFLTRELGIPASRLRVSVHTSDMESLALWERISGLRAADGRILRLGDADNFWSAGDAAGTPCGPCTEIFYDQDREVDGERWLEIWNIVFMQYARGARVGELRPLSRTCVDTGMGLERLASVMQHKHTNYDTDILKPSIEALIDLIHARTLSSPRLLYTDGLDTAAHCVALKVLVDHFRAAAFLIAEGVIPSNVGRGYVLRRIIRRAVRFATTLGVHEPFMADMLKPLQAALGDTYRELIDAQETIKSVITLEEKQFFATLSRGMRYLSDAFTHASSSGSARVVAGELAFKLYDAYGFPLDLTQLIAAEKGVSVDCEGFERCMQLQRAQSKAAAIGVPLPGAAGQRSTSADDANKIATASPSPIPAAVKQWQSNSTSACNTFIGYDNLSASPVRVLASHHDTATAHVWLALQPNPFYAHAGGQVGDTGYIHLQDGTQVKVLDCVRVFEGCDAIKVAAPADAAHLSQLAAGSMLASAHVDTEHRRNVAIHHSATHLLHAALKAVLSNESLSGTTALPAASINQSGSLVTASRLRFDFSCPKPLSAQQLMAVERWINAAILTAEQGGDAGEDGGGASVSGVQCEVMSREEATQQRKAQALFGEKYGEQVRVVSMAGGLSVELCGGTHVSHLRSVYPFCIVSEASIAAGVRRIEAVAGQAALTYMQRWQKRCNKAATVLKCTPDKLVDNVEKLSGKLKAAEAEIAALKRNALLATNNDSSASTTANKRSEGAEVRHASLRVKASDGTVASFPVRIQVIDPSLAGTKGVLHDACSAIVAAPPTLTSDASNQAVYHILVCSTTGTIGIAVPRSTASSSSSAVGAAHVWRRLAAACASSSTTATKPKGGGNEKIAQGVLPVLQETGDSASPRTLIDRIVSALEDEKIQSSN